MLKGLSKPVKIELVALLSDSVAFEDEAVEEPELTEEERKEGLMSHAGCWADDPEDAARMEAAIKECRENEIVCDESPHTAIPRSRQKAGDGGL